MTQDRDGLRTADYWYELPERLIAQDPLGDRAASRLLVLDRRTGAVRHRSFRDIAEYLVPGDVLVLNDTRVIPARLLGLRVPKGSDGSHASAGGRFHEGGSEAEILLLKRLGADRWECIVRPGKKLKEGDEVVFGTANALEERPPLRGVVEEVLPDGNRIVRFVFSGIWEEVLDTLGEMPLPPYITHRLKDKERYQTVYARQEGSAAAPTAGLHFTAELLRELENKGVRLVYVTLHVGLGTFRPVKEEDITRHVMHSEWYQISPEAAALINDAKANGRRVICVGTTSCRTVESAAAPEETSEEMAERQDLAPSSTPYRVRPGSADTSIFIYPGYHFRIMDGLLTNFHLPASTLLMLVSAFAGRENILAAYRAAVEEEYRFFSFGDAMLIM